MTDRRTFCLATASLVAGCAAGPDLAPVRSELAGTQRWLSGFVEEMKASGFVADALRRHGIEGATVAPRA